MEEHPNIEIGLEGLSGDEDEEEEEARIILTNYNMHFNTGFT